MASNHSSSVWAALLGGRGRKGSHRVFWGEATRQGASSLKRSPYSVAGVLTQETPQHLMPLIHHVSSAILQGRPYPVRRILFGPSSSALFSDLILSPLDEGSSSLPAFNLHGHVNSFTGRPTCLYVPFCSLHALSHTSGDWHCLSLRSLCLFQPELQLCWQHEPKLRFFIEESFQQTHLPEPSLVP
jgi:hypothetical protein